MTIKLSVEENFINIFEGQPCLWDTKSPQYYNRDARRKALETLATGIGLEASDKVNELSRPVPARRTFKDFYSADSSMTMDIPGLPGFPGNDHTMAAPVGPEPIIKGVPDIPRSTTDRRYSFLASPLMTNRKDIVKPGQFHRPSLQVRPQSAMGIMTPHGASHSSQHTTSGSHQYQGYLHDRPPSAMGTSWTGRGHGEGKPATMQITDGPSLESRIQALMTEDTVHDMESGHATASPHQRSYSHSDGYTARSPNLNENRQPPGNSNMDDVYATVSRRQDAVLRERRGQGYPSPSVANTRPGSRGPVIGRDNPAFTPDSSTPAKSEVSGFGSTSIDLRNAWQRLYGSSNEVNPVPRAVLEPRPASRQGVRVPDTQGPMSPYTNHGHQVSSIGKRPGSVMKSANNTDLDIGANRATYQVPSSRASPTLYNTRDIGIKPLEDDSPMTFQGHASFGKFGRQSPTGQSSSNQDPVSGSHNSSGLSSQSGNIPVSMETFKPNTFHHGNISPASKYPDMEFGFPSRPGSNSPRRKQQGRHTPTNINKSLGHRSRTPEFSDRDKQNDSPKNKRGTSSFQVSFSESEEESDANYPLGAMDSIFDYNDLPSETESCTAQAAARISPLESPRTRELHNLHGNRSPKIVPEHSRTKSPSRPDPSVSRTHRRNSDENWTNEQEGDDHPSEIEAKQNKLEAAHTRQHLLTDYARSRSLEDVRESGGESDLSFDVENTFLTVDPSDQSEMGTLKSKSSSMRAQLDRLEGMYSKVMRNLEDKGPSGGRTTRRWSIGSSDTSSLRRQHHHGKHGRSSQSQRMSNKDARSIGKRFQRLESHVITLARSVAHLSSELRSQNTMTREIENVKREMQELKNQSYLRPSGQGRSELDKYRGWIPPLTNPRRVHKLTKFFGQEPPLLEIFLKRLGYERYVKNFEQEHVGLMELPYMTEERLQSIGIPMGPRIRILQESQMCFTHDNFNIYIV